MTVHVFILRYSGDALENMRWIPRNQHSAIHAALEQQLRHQPQIETRNRKLLTAESEATERWELRCGTKNQFRVIYRVDTEESVVTILVIGVKKGNQLLVNGEEHEL